MNPYLTSQDEAKLIKPVIIKYNHTGVKCAIRRVWSVKGKHNVHHMARLVGKGLTYEFLHGWNMCSRPNSHLNGGVLWECTAIHMYL